MKEGGEEVSDLPFGEVGSDESRKIRPRESDIAVRFARKAENSSESGSPRRVHGLLTCSERNASFAVIKVLNSSTGQKHSTSGWNEHAGKGFPDYVTVFRGKAGNEAEDSVIEGPIETFRGQLAKEI